jgi:hypothetical protein
MTERNAKDLDGAEVGFSRVRKGKEARTKRADTVCTLFPVSPTTQTFRP